MSQLIQNEDSFLRLVETPKEETANAKPPSIASQFITNEYKFIQQKLPYTPGNKRFILPILLLGLQVLFTVIIALFAKLTDDEAPNKKSLHVYPVFQDVQVLTLLGFGFVMTFLKRYGYSSIGFNLLLVALVTQWSLIMRGFVESHQTHEGTFKIGILNFMHSDFTTISVLISMGALLGTVSLSQIVVMALFEVVAQVYNEYLNKNIIQTFDIGRSIHVHLFGALFGLTVSKVVYPSGVRSNKQVSVYHSDLFAFLGTLFLWIYYPSLNSLLTQHNKIEQTKAVINTLATMCSSCVVTFGVSSLVGKGKLSAFHAQHATLAGGIAIGTIANLNGHIYIALIVGSLAGLLSTAGLQYINPFIIEKLEINDTCGVTSLHALPALISGILGSVYAYFANMSEYKSLIENDSYRIYAVNTTSLLGRTTNQQAGYQLLSVASTTIVAIVSGILTGLVLKVPCFEKLNEDVEMFDDENTWITPDDYALKLTVVSNGK